MSLATTPERIKHRSADRLSAGLARVLVRDSATRRCGLRIAVDHWPHPGGARVLATVRDQRGDLLARWMPLAGVLRVGAAGETVERGYYTWRRVVHRLGEARP